MSLKPTRAVRVGIDGWYLQIPRGIGNSTRDLLLELSRIVSGNQYVVYIPKAFRPDGRLEGRPNLRFRCLPRVPYPLWEQALLPAAALRDGIDVLHCPGNTAPLHLPRRIKLVLTLHDVIFMAPPSGTGGRSSTYQSVGRAYRRYVAPRAAKRAVRILTDSAATRREIVSTLRVASDKVHVTPLAQGYEFHPLTPEDRQRQMPGRATSQEGFVLSFAAKDPRKNTRRVVDAFALFAAHNANVNLVMVGDDKTTARLGMHTEEVRSRVTLLGFVSREQLVALYGSALMVLYPSLNEGFGLPVLEAMACGAPVVTSRRGALNEVAGNAAYFVDPESTDDIAEAISLLAWNEPLRDRLRALGLARAAQFSWRNAAADVARLYGTL